ncbi:hypothetical protein Arub01_47010 [Actinomadura rubrobrunea]|uniref:Molecular chaperone DnaJ n=1 Tax=Actinomadura rubrobrunea TaxID=115335 RepID=A0A9W6PZ03_9ACTN|nr:hypothetical protein [Actinomadura rubrobrunea]GLW66457.1 hypothetical protein Arub01_47010 [Actinomadura rubrobrunea]
MGKHSKKVTCSMCNGTGKQTFNNDNRQEERPCPGCNGTGQV